MTSRPATAAADRVRLDRWLWAARFFKTRALAAAALDGGRVDVNGERAKRARLVRAGDQVRLRVGPIEYVMTVLALSERRGPAKVAATLYQEDPMAKRAREERALQLRTMPTAFFDGKGRPTKKQRRDIDRLKRSLVVVLSLVLPTALPAQQRPGAADRLPTDPNVTVGTLENGLRYYVRVNREPQKRAEFRLVVNAGSVLEDDDQQGLAHFVEHMAFNGTRNFPRQRLVGYLESIGMRFGPDVNAYTSFDETVYMLQVPTDTPSVVATAFQILDDWAHAVSFDSVEIDKERGVVIEEWRLGQGAGARMRDKQFPVIFKGSKYADRLPIGTKGSLESFRHEAARRFYQTWYRPNLMAVVAVGDFDGAEIERQIRSHFGDLRNPASPRPRPVVDVPDHAEPLFTVATDPEATGTTVGVLFKQPLRDHGTRSAYRQALVEDLFGAMLNARFFELSQQADPPFLGAGGGQGRFIGAKEVFQLFASVRENGVVRGLDALLTEAERVARFGFTAPELERARANRLRALERAHAEREKTNSAAYAGEYVSHFLEGEAIPGIDAELAMHREFLPGIALDETNRLAREWITPHNRVVTVSAPEKAGMTPPTETELIAVFSGVAGKTIVAYADTLSARALVARAPAPGRVSAERAIPELGLTEWRLANGITVVLKPTDYKDDEVVMQAISPGGSSLAPDDRFVSASMASTVINASGVGAFSAVDLNKVLAGKAVRLGPTVGTTDEGFFGTGSPRDIETLLQLAYLYVTEPRLDTAAFAALRGRLETFADNRGRSPEATFSDTLQVTMARGHARAAPLTGETIRRIDPVQAFSFYRDRFADVSDFTFFFVGTIDLAAMRPLIETWLGSLPGAGRQERWRDLGIRPPTGVIKKVVHKGLEPKARVQLVFSSPFEESFENRYMLESLGEALRIRLREVLREDMGGVYGVSVGASPRVIPDTGASVTVGFGADPARLNELVDSALAVIRVFQSSGPADSIVQKVQETQRRERETNSRRNAWWLGQLVTYHRNALDLRNLLERDRRVASLTAEAIRDAARRYIRFDNYVQVSLFPESGPAGGAVP
jgi:zinc protease